LTDAFVCFFKRLIIPGCKQKLKDCGKVRDAAVAYMEDGKCKRAKESCDNLKMICKDVATQKQTLENMIDYQVLKSSLIHRYTTIIS